MKSFSLVALLVASVEAHRLTAQPITADSGLYDSVASGWSGQQLPGRAFERPDTGLDDDTVLKKKAGAGHHYPHLVEVHAQPITSDSGLYDSVASGWSGQQLPGRAFERPDTGLDDDTVLRKRAQDKMAAMAEQRELYREEGF